jgi:NAD+ kinase
MATIAFVVHTRRPRALELAGQATEWLAARGHLSVLSKEDAEAVGLPDLGRDPVGLAEGVDLTVALGGDGTILRAVRMVSPGGVPVLGVNLGRLGYLTEVDAGRLTWALERFLAGEYDLEERMMLAVSVVQAGIVTEVALALNEAVVEKGSPGRTVNMRVSIDGRPWTTYVADGLIVATPTGSTAYAFSARGPILSPRLRALLLTPVSPHMPFDRSLVVSEDEAFRVEVCDDREAMLTVDGRDLGRLRDGDAIVCTAADQAARFVTFGARDFYGILKAKFGVADR